MRPKTIFILVAIAILIYVAGKPLGQIFVTLGNMVVQIGQNMQKVGH